MTAAVRFAVALLFALVAALLAVPADPARADDGHPGGSYPLHQAAGADGDLAVVVHLLGSPHGIDVNATAFVQGPPYYENDRPLHQAALYGHAAIAAALVTAGADVNAKDGMNFGGDTPLSRAAQFGHAPVVSVLIAAGADVNLGNSEGSAPLHNAGSFDIELPDASNYNVGADRAERGRAQASVISMLIAAGATVNVKNVFGNTPLHIAAVGSAAAASVLLAMGAEANAKNMNGETPLAFAPAPPPLVRAVLLAAGGHWGDDCAGDEAVVNPAGPSPPCLCEGRFYSTEKSACVPYAPCLGGTLDAGANTCECPDGLAALGDGVCEYAAATCETLGGIAEGEDDRVCSGIDWNDTFCIVGSDSAFPCLGLFYHVWQCNEFNRPALDPFHCAKKCEVGFRARGARCAIIN